MTEIRNPPPSKLAATPWLPLLLSASVWGGNIVVARLAVGEVSPMALVSLRWIIVSALVLAYAGGDVGAALNRLRPHWPFVAAMGVAGFTFSNSLLFLGARWTTGLNIAVGTAVQPAMVVVGASIAYGARLTAQRVVGVFTTFLGILLVATQGDLGAIGALRFNVGDLIELAGIACYALYTVALRRQPALPAFVLFIGLAIAAAATSLPLLGLEIASGAVLWPSAKGWMAIFYVAIFTSIVGHVSWIRTVGLIGPSRAGVFQNLVPLIGAGLSVLVLGEELRWFHAASLGLVILGIWVSERWGK